MFQSSLSAFFFCSFLGTIQPADVLSKIKYSITAPCSDNKCGFSWGPYHHSNPASSFLQKKNQENLLEIQQLRLAGLSGYNKVLFSLQLS
jgi:hypothetical protein